MASFRTLDIKGMKEKDATYIRVSKMDKEKLLEINRDSPHNSIAILIRQLLNGEVVMDKAMRRRYDIEV